MTYTTIRHLVAATCVLTILSAAGAQGRPVSTKEIDGYLRFLSSDALEGRAPGSRTDPVTTAYLEGQLLAFGAEPAKNGSFIQKVPLEIIRADSAGVKAVASGKATMNLRFPEDVVIWGRAAKPAGGAKAEIVFAGYGAVAPEYKWNDFKDVDVRGKIIMVLVNDPPAPASEPNLFGGRAMTWYGRWPYKLEEGERQGAAGVLIVHTTERAGYPWHTVVGSWSGEQRMLPRSPKAPPPLGFGGWITDSAATALLSKAGLDLAKLRKSAESRDFKPVNTGITLDVSFTNSVRKIESANVVGLVKGSDRKLSSEYVVLTAHWDHLGVGPKVNGDSIYNGTEDNASGTAVMLSVARLAAQTPLAQRPKRSFLFAFVTAEESGLLGSEFLAQNPVVPARDIVANVNVDGGNLLGVVNDFNVLGDAKSSLGPELAAMLKPRNLRITPDAFPERGAFYRSDHFSFARAGVPSVSIGEGEDFAGHPKGWGLQQHEDYTSNRYHQPADNYRPDFDLRGAVQLSGIVLDFAKQLGNDLKWPEWNADAEFHRPGRSVVP
jgi:Zn-dependent M28 family amino/carboxypeptidase